VSTFTGRKKGKGSAKAGRVKGQEVQRVKTIRVERHWVEEIETGCRNFRKDLAKENRKLRLRIPLKRGKNYLAGKEVEEKITRAKCHSKQPDITPEKHLTIQGDGED